MQSGRWVAANKERGVSGGGRSVVGVEGGMGGANWRWKKEVKVREHGREVEGETKRMESEL